MFYWLMTHVATPGVATLVIILIAIVVSAVLNPN